MTVVAVVGACTALFAATIGCFQNDFKKISYIETEDRPSVGVYVSDFLQPGVESTHALYLWEKD